MGTRAAFFVGEPWDIDNREYLGCICWDGYPDGDCSKLADARSPEEFRGMVKSIADSRDDFIDPSKPFPFPWGDDLFLTDCIYGFYDGHAWTDVWGKVSRHMVKVRDLLELDEDGWEALESHAGDPRTINVLAPNAGDWSLDQDPSIIVMRAK